MRGPSSSHCAASLRIGRLCRDLMGNNIMNILIEFDPNGSLANTHTGQGSDMGLFGGFLGWEADDERLPESDYHIGEAGIKVQFGIRDINAKHLNTYHITLSNPGETRTVTAISTGGGMIEVIAIDGIEVSIMGDFYETLVYCKEPGRILELFNSEMSYDYLIVHGGNPLFIEIKAQRFPGELLQVQLDAIEDVISIKKLGPVLPVLSRKDIKIPFSTCNEMLDYNKNKNLSLLELAILYESERGNISEEEIFEKMRKIVRILKDSIANGLRGTQYADRLLGSQSVNFKNQLQNNRLIETGALNIVVMYVSALMEVGVGKEIPSGTFPSIEWIDFSNKEQDIGVTLAHFGIPSHEIRDNSIYLTLLRGVETLSADGTKGPCIATPDAAEKRPYTFKYSLIPHNGDWRDASSYKEGISFNMKPTAIHVSKKEHQIWNDKLRESDPAGTLVDTNLPNGFSFLSISPKNVILSTLKLPQHSSINSNSKGVILRVYETEGKTVTADIKFQYPIKSAAYVNLMEDKKDNTMEAITVSGPSKNILSLPIQGFKIITLRIEFDFYNQLQTNDDFL